MAAPPYPGAKPHGLLGEELDGPTLLALLAGAVPGVVLALGEGVRPIYLKPVGSPA